MKTYMSRKERENVCVLFLVASAVDEMLEKWTDLTKEEHKAIKTVQTWIYKFMDSIMNRKDRDVALQLKRDIQNSEIMILPKYEAKKEWERREEQAKYIEVKRDTLLNLAEHALIGCEGCTRKDYYNCDLREAFIKLDIEPFDYEAVDKCQYKVEVERKKVS